jgi:hypothetical protein
MASGSSSASITSSSSLGDIIRRQADRHWRPSHLDSDASIKSMATFIMVQTQISNKFASGRQFYLIGTQVDFRPVARARLVANNPNLSIATSFHQSLYSSIDQFVVTNCKRRLKFDLRRSIVFRFVAYSNSTSTSQTRSVSCICAAIHRRSSVGSGRIARVARSNASLLLFGKQTFASSIN